MHDSIRRSGYVVACLGAVLVELQVAGHLVGHEVSVRGVYHLLAHHVFHVNLTGVVAPHRQVLADVCVVVNEECGVVIMC